MYGLEKCNKMCEDLTKECIENFNKVSVDTELIKEMTKTVNKRDLNKGRVYMSDLYQMELVYQKMCID